MNTDTAGSENYAKESYPLLAERLRVWRKTNGWPQKRVADELGVSEATWSRWEQGRRFPSPAFLTLLAQYLRLPISRFFYDSTDPCPFCPFEERRLNWG